MITLRGGIAAACGEHDGNEEWCAQEYVANETMQTHSREVRGARATMKRVREETARRADAQCSHAAECLRDASARSSELWAVREPDGSERWPAGARAIAGWLVFRDSHYRDAHNRGKQKRALRELFIRMLCAVGGSPLALALESAHLCVSGQLDTGDYRVQFLFPIPRGWAHPGSTLPVSYTVEEARRHMGISERSPPRAKSPSRNPLVLVCRT